MRSILIVALLFFPFTASAEPDPDCLAEVRDQKVACDEVCFKVGGEDADILSCEQICTETYEQALSECEIPDDEDIDEQLIAEDEQ